MSGLITMGLGPFPPTAISGPRVPPPTMLKAIVLKPEMVGTMLMAIMKGDKAILVLELDLGKLDSNIVGCCCAR